MRSFAEGAEAIGEVDARLAAVGLEHGRRSTRGGSWSSGERVRPARRSRAKAIEAQHSVETTGILRVKAWQDFSWLKAGFSTRQGGVSRVYGGDSGSSELNL